MRQAGSILPILNYFITRASFHILLKRFYNNYLNEYKKCLTLPTFSFYYVQKRPRTKNSSYIFISIYCTGNLFEEILNSVSLGAISIYIYLFKLQNVQHGRLLFFSRTFALFHLPQIKIFIVLCQKMREKA